MQNTFISTISQTVQELGMLKEKDAVLAGVSGGPDSIALVLVLLELKERYGLAVGIAHVNHQLRGEDARKDEAFVRDFAEEYNLLFHLKQADVKAFAEKHKLSVEDAGRKVRYAFFDQTARENGYTKIATGHHKDDNAELILINLLRGSGPRGLSGIPPIRNDRIIRPLIGVSKDDIKAFLASENKVFREDASNSDPRFLRNRIRSQLIPLLQSEYNPEIIDSLDRLSRILRDEELFWEEQTSAAFHTCLDSRADDTLVLSQKVLRGLDAALLGRVIRKAIETVKLDLKRISHLHIRSIIEFIQTTGHGSSLDLPGQIRIYKKKGTITFKKECRPLREIGKEQKIQHRRLKHEK